MEGREIWRIKKGREVGRIKEEGDVDDTGRENKERNKGG